MKSPGSIRCASRVKVAAGRYTARREKAKRDQGGAQTVVDERAKLGQCPGQVCESRVSVERKQICVVDTAHPPIDVLADRVCRFRAGDAAPQRIGPYSREDQEHRPTVTRHGLIVETAARVAAQQPGCSTARRYPIVW